MSDMRDVLHSNRFGYVIDIVHEWFADRELSFTGKISDEGPDDLDPFLFKIFDVPFPKKRDPYISTLKHAFDDHRSIDDIIWLWSAHGLTLFKAAVLRAEIKEITWGKNDKGSVTGCIAQTY